MTNIRRLWGRPASREGQNEVLREAMKAAEQRALDQAGAPPPPTTIVGAVVTNIDRALQNFRNQETILIAERDAKVEALRQTQAAIKSMELALTEMCDDPALTDEQRATASEPFKRSVVDPLERDLYAEVEADIARGRTVIPADEGEFNLPIDSTGELDTSQLSEREREIVAKVLDQEGLRHAQN